MTRLRDGSGATNGTRAVSVAVSEFITPEESPGSSTHVRPTKWRSRP